MDCEFNNSSDILFPSDAGLPKLSSPLDYKVPESFDWATQDFMYTFHDKSTNELNNFLCFKQYVPVHKQEEQEKQILSQVHQYLSTGQSELNEILKGFHLSVQKSIQNNQAQNTLPGLSWAEEANEYYGGNDIGDLTMVQELEGKKQKIELDDDDNIESLSDIITEEKPLPVLPKKKKSTLFNKIKSNTRKVFRKLLVIS
ncbi:hypothetical protein G6F57_010388 [Rhizopus arrhizus]|jgi:hypothetical protein|uniref:Uncharacterized protein n=1 Tax=Rhizopus oryzae TaxID=64495 RepID=A0A9P6WYR7_RHIOR|nr:hypothetical protein G6F24_010297 [Rhizopus arrhizus]KAG0767169.1 hypothetical protein G6F22_017696 [Rhizopus arrhizus]KAG0778884.1 hypothetical protein G6F21_012805 [Rhizopus arrhizus]KAG0808115.1 hypothetical protein G6F20_009838 [Rhizopus arrhizus]KAG0831101.1 hypothetical protein G6F19_006901 [Rhizopus arrhizus]